MSQHAFQGQKVGDLSELWTVGKAPGRRAPAPQLGAGCLLQHTSSMGERGSDRGHPGPAVTGSAPPRHAPQRTATLTHPRPRHSVRSSPQEGATQVTGDGGSGRTKRGLRRRGRTLGLRKGGSADSATARANLDGSVPSDVSRTLGDRAARPDSVGQLGSQAHRDRKRVAGPARARGGDRVLVGTEGQVGRTEGAWG